MENNGFIIINLLPYREKIKNEKIRKFGLMMGFFAALAAGVVFAGHTYLSMNIEAQQGRNKFIEAENKKLDEDIKSIASLREEIRDTLAKRQVVESLQVNRSDGVNIMNELANQLPEGVIIKSVKRLGEKLTIVGNTQSNAKVSTYMTNLDASATFMKPELVEIKALGAAAAKTGSKPKTVGEDLKMSEYTISVVMERRLEAKPDDKKNKVASK